MQSESCFVSDIADSRGSERVKQCPMVFFLTDDLL